MTTTASTSDRVLELESENASLRRVAGIRKTLAESFRQLGYDDKSIKERRRFILEKLAACSPENHVWLGVHAVLDDMITLSHGHIHDPSASNEVLRYNSGRESALEDFRNILIASWTAANKAS